MCSNFNVNNNINLVMHLSGYLIVKNIKYKIQKYFEYLFILKRNLKFNNFHNNMY